MSRVNGTCRSQMSGERWRNGGMPPKLRSTFAENATAAIEFKGETIRNARAQSETLRKRLTRIAQGAGPSTTIETIEWFAELVGVDPWELFVPSFDPHNRPRLLASDSEISGLDGDELRLVRLLRGRGQGSVAALLSVLESGNKSVAEPELGGSGASHGPAQRASNE